MNIHATHFCFILTYSAPRETRQRDVLVTKHKGPQLSMDSRESRRDLHQYQIHPQVQTKVRFFVSLALNAFKAPLLT